MKYKIGFKNDSKAHERIPELANDVIGTSDLSKQEALRRTQNAARQAFQNFGSMVSSNLCMSYVRREIDFGRLARGVVRAFEMTADLEDDEKNRYIGEFVSIANSLTPMEDSRSASTRGRGHPMFRILLIKKLVEFSQEILGLPKMHRNNATSTAFGEAARLYNELRIDDHVFTEAAVYKLYYESTDRLNSLFD